jgi:hypothetical protein
MAFVDRRSRGSGPAKNHKYLPSFQLFACLKNTCSNPRDFFPIRLQTSRVLSVMGLALVGAGPSIGFPSCVFFALRASTV